jgi:hypothetical protein
MLVEDCHAARRTLAARNDTDSLLMSEFVSEGQPAALTADTHYSSAHNIFQIFHLHHRAAV